ncbi:hypothetical protein PCE1_003770 [Barthelona sp. PCE]
MEPVNYDTSVDHTSVVHPNSYDQKRTITDHSAIPSKAQYTHREAYFAIPFIEHVLSVYLPSDEIECCAGIFLRDIIAREVLLDNNNKLSFHLTTMLYLFSFRKEDDDFENVSSLMKTQYDLSIPPKVYNINFLTVPLSAYSRTGFDFILVGLMEFHSAARNMSSFNVFMKNILAKLKYHGFIVLFCFRSLLHILRDNHMFEIELEGTKVRITQRNKQQNSENHISFKSFGSSQSVTANFVNYVAFVTKAQEYSCGVTMKQSLREYGGKYLRLNFSDTDTFSETKLVEESSILCDIWDVIDLMIVVKQ